MKTDYVWHYAPPLALHAAPFRMAVWEILLTIPYGGLDRKAYLLRLEGAML